MKNTNLLKWKIIPLRLTTARLRFGDGDGKKGFVT